MAPWASAHQGDHLLGIEGAEVLEPAWMSRLPCLTVLKASSLLSVMGEFAVEVFAGSAVLTLGMMLSSVPVVKPWDAKYGDRFNVLTEGQILLSMIAWGLLAVVHIATPCLTSTFARRTPLRSWESPLGVEGLPESEKELLDDGNRLIAWSMTVAKAAHAAQSYFSVENPFPSYFWINPMVVEVWVLTGVIVTVFSMQPFGVVYDKTTGFLSNIPEIWLVGSRKEEGGKPVALVGKAMMSIHCYE